MSEENQEFQERIIPINIEEEMKTAYIDYSMSVIVSRAIPDVRDGLKPVHRRILYAMDELGLQNNKPYKKSARIVGEVLGKYHPHGDTSVYDSLVRMAQDWSLRYPLVDGQGNFGSMDNDPPAAMRYTEARFQKITEEMLTDIEKDTVDFGLNFDDTLKEPTVLPTRVPNLLVNGVSGIAVGMATNILPHNLSEVIDGTIAYIEDNEITVEGLMQHVKAPDFPTGGTIYGYEGVREGFETGRGRVVVRGKTRMEETKTGRMQIIIDEIPYQVNREGLINKIADLVNDKKIEGISNVNDESGRQGFRVVVDLKRDAMPNVVLNQLFKYTQLQTSFGVNNIALDKGRPKVMNLKDMIAAFVEFRHEVVIRRTKFELKKAEERAHILEGLMIALDNLDDIIELIKRSKNPAEARIGLMETFHLSEIQAQAILDLRLHRLTALERDKIREEHEEIMKKIEHLKAILANADMRFDIIKGELIEIKDKYGDERRTDIEMAGDEFSIEDMIAEEDVVITISHLGYIKRTQTTEYRKQNRGGRGSRGSQTRDEDFVEHLLVASTHDYIMVFTEQGRCFWLKAYQIPEGTKTSKGRAIQNIINLPQDDKVKAYIKVRSLSDEEFINNHHIVFCTKKGVIKKTLLEAFSRPRQNGINAITIHEGDQLLEVALTDGNSDIMMAIRSGRAIRFPEEKVRSMGRSAAGVRGVTLEDDNDRVVGMVCVSPSSAPEIFVVSEKGYGKRSELEEYRITNRGGKGVKTINVTDKTGGLIALKAVTDEDDLMIINKSGIIIRIGVEAVRVMGRATQGVRLINLGDNDEIADVAKVTLPDDVELDEEGNPIISEGEGLNEGEENQSNEEETDNNETESEEN